MIDKMDKQKLLYGWCGEFGWEIITVIPEINVLQNDYDITLYGFHGTEGMYSDMNVTFVPHNLDQRGSGYGRNYGKTQWEQLDLSQFQYDVLRLHYHPDTKKIKVKKIPKIIREDINPQRKRKVTVHARMFSNSKTGRNWHENYNGALKYLIDNGFEIVFIGHPQCSEFLPQFGKDCRGLDMSETIMHIKESTLTLGPSSGPMVLSLWCATPVFTWSCGDTRMFHTDRGSDLWNPFKIKHFHPWSTNETKANIKLYRSAAYKPLLKEMMPGLEFAISQLEAI